MSTFRVYFRTGDKIYTRLVEGRFPRWQDVFPARKEGEITFKVEELRDALMLAKIATGEESRGVDMSLDMDTLFLKGSASDVGTSEVECAITNSGNLKTVVAFDPNYAAPATNAMEANSRYRLALRSRKIQLVFSNFKMVSRMPLCRSRGQLDGSESF